MRHSLLPLAVLLLATAACQRSTGTAAAPESTEREHAAMPSTSPPANVSHGEAPIGTTAEAPPVPADLPPLEPGTVHKIAFEVKDATITLDTGVTYHAWTFNGRVPGPFIHVRQGDTVDFTLTNHGTMEHSMDFHAAEIAPDKYYKNVPVGQSIHYSYVANVPGAFMYHCGTAPVAMHIANGMYGALIVDPKTPRPPARELVLVESEFYLAEASGSAARTLDWDHLLSLAPDYVVFNGRASQYATHPIEVQPGELVRLYVVNAGPNRISSFHVVGGIFEKVFQDSTQANPLIGVQTVNVPVGGSGIFEIRLHEPGDYPFVTHAFADATKGAVGVLRALGPGQVPGQATATPSPMKH